MTLLIIGLVLCFLSGVAKSVMDISSEDNFNSPWWNKNQSWKNKYKYKPAWLWLNFLVFLTDGWHLMQFFFLNLLMIGIVIMALVDYPEWYFLLCGFIAMRLAFTIFYNLIKWIRKK